MVNGRGMTQMLFMVHRLGNGSGLDPEIMVLWRLWYGPQVMNHGPEIRAMDKSTVAHAPQNTK